MGYHISQTRDSHSTSVTHCHGKALEIHRVAHVTYDHCLCTMGQHVPTAWYRSTYLEPVMVPTRATRPREAPSPRGEYLVASSDKDTVHVFAIGGPGHPGSSMPWTLRVYMRGVGCDARWVGYLVVSLVYLAHLGSRTRSGCVQG